jgi:hypothetical protein
MIISIEANKILQQNSTSFLIKTLMKLGTEGTYLNLIKALYGKPEANIILNGEKVKAFPKVWNLLAKAIRQEE